MDIERLKRKRQKNVQEQNRLAKEHLRIEATYYRQHPEAVPYALVCYAERQGIDWCRTIVLDLGINEPGTSTVFGRLLTQDRTFIEFDMDLTDDFQYITDLYQWQDITVKQNLSHHNRGTGIGDGALAIEVLIELNSD